MTKKQSIFAKGGNKASVVAGRNVYRDRHGNSVLYDPRTHTGYIIRAKDEAGFSVYHGRFFVALAAGVLGASILNNYIIPIVGAIVVYAVLEYRYRKNYLPSLVRIENFKPEEKRTLQKALIEAGNKPRCFLLFVLYMAFGIFFPIYELQQHAPLLFLGVSFAVTIVCFYMAYNYLQAALHIKES